LPGDLLYFYENGTSTPKVVYQDVALTTPHTNPVVASSAGLFPPIFLAGTYRVELKSAAGVTQSGWPVDNVGGEETQGQFDDWSSITSYYEGDLVTGSNGLRYQAKALQPNLNRDPLTSPTYWQEVRFTSEYNPLSAYAVGDWVYYLNDWYRCKATALGQTPSVNSAFWDAEKNLFQWNSTTTYAANDAVSKGGLNYRSLSGSNTGNDPSTSQAFWVLAKEQYEWNSGVTYSSGVYVFDGDRRYISKQSANLNNKPSLDVSETFWRPDWQAFAPLTIVRTMTGGGALTPFTAHDLTDSSTYTLPLASTVPSGGFIDATKPEQFKGNQPIVARSGSDIIRYNGGTDTSVRYTLNYRSGLRYKSNGINEWSI
jgi:hypothetical protein